ncbi:uncharacterized protein LOC126765384 [Bactrocera neohumeralis]|uniref:uncharacterized protein LOC126765384 n=1 Tax=Bactrocera neohumeralis TaxID=98809 RepID=UPI0021662BF0|nr:uncharacterized protein LOC126765384 [Bactrocera neohumeralis]
MLKIGKRIGPHQQLCLAHGIQLGILDVMYKRQIRIEPNEISICEDDDSEEDTRDQTDCIQLADNEERGELTDEFDIKTSKEGLSSGVTEHFILSHDKVIIEILLLATFLREYKNDAL